MTSTLDEINRATGSLQELGELSKEQKFALYKLKNRKSELEFDENDTHPKTTPAQKQRQIDFTKGNLNAVREELKGLFSEDQLRRLSEIEAADDAAVAELKKRTGSKIPRSYFGLGIGEADRLLRDPKMLEAKIQRGKLGEAMWNKAKEEGRINKEKARTTGKVNKQPAQPRTFGSAAKKIAGGLVKRLGPVAAVADAVSVGKSLQDLRDNPEQFVSQGVGSNFYTQAATSGLRRIGNDIGFGIPEKVGRRLATHIDRNRGKKLQFNSLRSIPKFR